MSYAIVGFGKIGQALAHAFARKNINLTVASRRPPEALAPEARAIGPTVVAKSLRDALEAETIILAVPFGEHREVAKALSSWEGKTVIDATNAFGVPPEALGGLVICLRCKGVHQREGRERLQSSGCGYISYRSDRRGRPPGRLPVERRRGRNRTRSGFGQETWVRTRQAGKAQ